MSGATGHVEQQAPTADPPAPRTKIEGFRHGMVYRDASATSPIGAWTRRFWISDRRAGAEAPRRPMPMARAVDIGRERFS